jgi:hypothetical protein
LASEIDRGNVAAKRADRVKRTAVPACQIFPTACRRLRTDGIGYHYAEADDAAGK